MPKPKDMANLNRITSTCKCTNLIHTLLCNTDIDLIFHQQTILAVQAEHQARESALASSILHQISKCNSATPHFRRHLDYLQQPGTGQWLSAMPSSLCGTMPSSAEFPDELCNLLVLLKNVENWRTKLTINL